MFSIITGWDDVVGTFVHTHLGSRWIPNSGTAIGLVDDAGTLIAGVTYTLFNGANCVVDVVGTRAGWCQYPFLHCFFSYPFDQLKCTRITAPVASNNPHSLRFVKRLGFYREALLKDGAPGCDVILHRMYRSECRYLEQPEQFARVFHNG